MQPTDQGAKQPVRTDGHLPTPGSSGVERPGAGGPEPLGSPARGAACWSSPLTHSPLTYSALCPALPGKAPGHLEETPVLFLTMQPSQSTCHSEPSAQKHSWPGRGPHMLVTSDPCTGRLSDKPAAARRGPTVFMPRIHGTD